MRKLIRIFGAEFDPLESKAFSFRPAPDQIKATGLLFSNDAHVSVSFENNMSLTTNQIEFAYRNEAMLVSPSKRAISIDENLTTCQVISGTVQNLKTVHQGNEKRTINIYLQVDLNEN